MPKETHQPIRLALIKDGKVESVLMFDTMPEQSQLTKYDHAIDTSKIEGDKPGPGWGYDGAVFTKPVEASPEVLGEPTPTNNEKIIENIKQIDIMKLKETDTGKAIVLLLSAVLNVDESEFIA